MNAQQAVVIDAFTELAPQYEATVDREVREFCGIGYREFIRQLASIAAVQDNELVLDVASGTAISSIEIATSAGPGPKIISLDITPAMQLYGATNIVRAGLRSQIRQVCASAMAIPLTSASVDVVICGLGTHHIGILGLLQEVKRVVKPGGRIVFADVGAHASWRRIWGRAVLGTLVTGVRVFSRSARWQAEADAFQNILTADEWRAYMLREGFAQVVVHESPARKWWYPSLLIMTAVSESDP